ncbi:MAG: gp58-like family protein [Limosilactobacillus mucosae]
MTSDLLATVWTGIKDITYYPYTLNWFGNPNLEAGDWVTLTDTQGNKFNVPVNQYTMSFNGGLESTISATQSSSTAGGYAYTGSAGSIKNMIEALQVRHTASGNIVYPPSYQGEPKNPKKGDVWYKQNGNNVEMWIYQEEDGKSAWVKTPLDGEVKAEIQALDKKTNEDLTRVKGELSSEAESQWESAKAATREVASDLSATKASLAAVNNDLSATKNRLEDTRTSLATAANDLTNVKTSLATTANDLSATKNSLETATSEFQKKTGQLSGSLSTANSKIEFNTNAIAEVKHTANEISTTVSNIRVGGRNLLTNTRTLSDVWNGATETVDGFTVAKATQSNAGSYDPITWNGLTTIKSNTDYTLTFYAKASKATGFYSYLYNIGTGDTYMDGSTRNDLTTDYKRYVVHFHTAAMPTGRTVACLPLRLIEQGVTAWIYGVQLEEGNTATQWQPAPEDTDQAISKVSQTADAIKAGLANTNGDVASVKATASILQSQIIDNKNNISSVEQTASGLTSRVGSAEENISQLQQTANGLTSTVSNMKVGGRNLLSGDTKSEHTASYPASGNVDMTQIMMLSPANQTQYTLSFDAKSTHTGDSITCYLYNSISGGHDSVVSGENNQGVKSQIVDGNMPFTLTESYQRFWVKWTNNPNDGKLTVICGRLFAGAGSGSVSIKNIKLEVGNTPTDWTPAPETFDEEISQIKQTAGQIKADVADNKGNISSVTQTANAVKADLKNTKGDVASVKAKADSLTTQLSDANSNISALQLTAKGLQSTVAGQDGKISQLQHDADGLKFTVANGGQNLILNSGNPSTLDHWTTTGNVTLQKHQFWKNGTENLFVLSNTSSTEEKFLSSERFAIEPNQDYILSFYAFNNSALRDVDVWYLPRKSGSSNDFDTAIALAPGVKFSASNAQYVKIRFNSGDYSEGYIRFDNNSSTTEGTSADLWLTDIQLEKGSIATAWSPSPGDIAQLKITADGLTTRVSNAEGNISSVQETAKKLQATVGDDNTGLVSYVKAIPGQISSAITASKQATVIESATDLHDMKTAGYYLLKGTLTNSPVTAWAFLRVITSDSGDRIYHRIWKDSASTVYTEEWTGSWSGWATHINSDNLKSNVITAINQSTEGVSISGAKITLDGNVNVAPGFTLSADHIQAGTLSADRISGGTLNFSNITVDGLTANSISSGSISGQNLNINLDNGTVEFTKGNLHSTDGGFNISIDNKSVYLDIGNGSKLWIDSNGFHLQESATQQLWMNKDGLHNFTDANGNGVWLNDTELKVLNSANAGLVAKDGMLQFSANPIWNSDNVYSGTLSDQLYGTIGFNSNLLSSSLNGIFIKGREGVVIGTNSYGGGSLFGPDGYLDVGEAGSGINLPDDLNKPASIFTKSALTLLGGQTYPAFWDMSDKARVCIGCDTYYTHNGASMVSGGNHTRGSNISINARNTNIIGYDWVNIDCRNGRIALNAQWVHSYPTYNHTTSAGANVYVAEDGALIRSSSARKYKTDIQDADNDYGAKLIEFAPKKWIDKAEKKHYEEDPENNKKPGYYYGLIADDLDAAGLDMLVNYGAEGEVEGINYDRLAVALLPVIKSLKDQVASLKEQIKELTK